MISLTELRAMRKENKIRGYLHYDKSEFVDVLVKRVLLPETIKTTLSLHHLSEKIPRKK